MLKNIIKRHKLEGVDTIELLKTSTLYLCRVIDTRAFRELTRDCVENFAEFKNDIRSDGYLHLNLKPYVFYCVKNRLKPKEARLQLRHFDVKFGDFDCLKHLMQDAKCLNQFKKFDKYKAHTLARYKQLLSSTLSSCEYYAIRFVNTKLVFLTMGSYLTKEDLTSELMMKAYDALLLQYPCIESKLHHENICRRAIHNFGLNTLYYYNGKGRANMVNNRDGTFTTTSYYYQGTQVEGNNVDIALDYQVSADDESEKGLCLQQLLDRYSGTDKRFISILSGTYDVKFSKYLKTKKLLPNDELYDKTSLDKYIDLACDHLNMSGYKAQTLIRELRNQIEV